MADALDDEWWLEQDVENTGNFLNKKNQTFIYVIVYSLYLILKFLPQDKMGEKRRRKEVDVQTTDDHVSIIHSKYRSDFDFSRENFSYNV